MAAAAPRPKSPPATPRHRLQLAVDALHREIGFLESEINSIDGIHTASRCCKEVDEFIGRNPDPFIMISSEKQNHDHSHHFLKKFRASACLMSYLSWICCCCSASSGGGCSSFQLKRPSCCSSSSCSGRRCSCCFSSCAAFKMSRSCCRCRRRCCSSSCGSGCASCGGGSSPRCCCCAPCTGCSCRCTCRPFPVGCSCACPAPACRCGGGGGACCAPRCCLCL